MHNCKRIQEDLAELALGERDGERNSLLGELEHCPACREELAALSSTLHVSSQALRSVLPGEDFWRGYHARLRSKVLAAAQDSEDQPRRKSSLPFIFRVGAVGRAFVTSSIRLPVPLALAALVLIATSFVVLRAPAKTNATNQPVVVETKTIERPVIQEKIVTRVVYVEKKVGQSGRFGEHKSQAVSDSPNSVAAMRGGSARKGVLSLVGFKPTDQVQLTIIKGSSQDEK